MQGRGEPPAAAEECRGVSSLRLTPKKFRRCFGEKCFASENDPARNNTRRLGSFVFGMDGDDADVFSRTVDWAISQGIETATFHILTPYPGTGLYQRMAAEERLLHSDWDRYDTRQVVFQPAQMTATQLEEGYWRAYREFYTWSGILRGARTKDTLTGALRQAAYAGGWKKFEPLWDTVIRAKKVAFMLPVLESILSGCGRGDGEKNGTRMRRIERMGTDPRGAN